jgi:drug/metabolite transporter (DMT)-like permease
MSAGRVSMLWMLAFVVLWTVVEQLASGVLNAYSPYQVVWTRYAVHIALMLALWGWREPATLWRTRRPAYQIIRSLLMLGMPASWVVSMQHGVDPQTLMAVFWLSPLLILALAHVALGERAPWPVWLAGALVCVGANLLFLHRPVPPLASLLFPLGMALSFSLYVVMTRSLRSETLRANLFYTALGVLLALTPALPGLWRSPSPHDLAVMVGVGVLGFGALYALDRMAAAAPVSLAAPVTSLQLVCMLGVAWISGHTHEGWRAGAGVLIIGLVTVGLWARERALPVRSASWRAAGMGRSTAT